MNNPSGPTRVAGIAFPDVQNILENAVNGDDIGKHGNFWRNKTRDQFVGLTVMGKQLLVVGDSANSNLIRGIFVGSLRSTGRSPPGCHRIRPGARPPDQADR